VKLASFGGAFFILLAERVGMPKEWWRMVMPIDGTELRGLTLVMVRRVFVGVRGRRNAKCGMEPHEIFALRVDCQTLWMSASLSNGGLEGYMGSSSSLLLQGRCVEMNCQISLYKMK
jgi:hypothetical protein